MLWLVLSLLLVIVLLLWFSFQTSAKPHPSTTANDVLVISTDRGRTGSTTHTVNSYSFHTPSIVGNITGESFLDCNERALLIGGTGTTIAFASDINNSGYIWKLSINQGGCWQAPFSAHVAEEVYTIIKGSWTFRWYSPEYPPIGLDGVVLSFDYEGRPSGPNIETTLGSGDVVIFERGSYYEWGSDVGGSTIIVHLTGTALDGSPNEIARIVEDYNRGEITAEELPAILAAFVSKYQISYNIG